MHNMLLDFWAGFRFTTQLIKSGIEVTRHTDPNLACLQYQKLLEHLKIDVQYDTPLPRGSWMGFSNHQSWIDILVLGALTPGRFIAKSEVKDFPYFGKKAEQLGTFFVKRGRPLSDDLRDRVAAAVRFESRPVICFPEGTTNLRPGKLKRGFLEFVQNEQLPSLGIFLSYSSQQEIAWLGDALLAPHIWKNITRKHRIRCHVSWKICDPTQEDLKLSLDEFYRTQSEVYDGNKNSFSVHPRHRTDISPTSQSAQLSQSV